MITAGIPRPVLSWQSAAGRDPQKHDQHGHLLPKTL